MIRLESIAVSLALVCGGAAMAQNNVLVLDGRGSHVAVPHHASQNTSTAMTIEYWAAITQYSGRPVHKRSGSDGQFNTQANLQCGPAWGVEAFGVGGNNATCLPLPPTQYRPALHGAWNHYAVTWSAASRRLRCYVNGVLVGDFANTGPAMRQSTDPLCFGDVGLWPNQDFRGRLDNIRLWGVERTQAQIATTAMTSFTPAQAQAAAGLIGSWSFDDGTAADATGLNSGTLTNGARVEGDDWFWYGWSSPVPIAYANADCNGDGILDAYQIATSQLADADNDGVPDACGCTPPAVAGQPEAIARRPGQDATFVTMAIGGPVRHQWRRDGMPLVNGGRVRGADAATLVITDLMEGDQGAYDCELVSACGSVVTTPAMLHIRTIEEPATILSVVREAGISRSYCPNVFTARHEREGAWSAPSPPWIVDAYCYFGQSEYVHTSEVWPWNLSLDTAVSGFLGNQRSSGSAASSLVVTFETSTMTRFDFRAVWSTDTNDYMSLGGPGCRVLLERLSPDPVVLVESSRQLLSEPWCCGIFGDSSCCRPQDDVWDCCTIDDSCCRPICVRCGDDVSFSSSLPPGRYRLDANASAAGAGDYSGQGSSTSLLVSLALNTIGCIGDFNTDGGVDGQDVAAFFSVWESGEANADINADGGIDGQDLFEFFERWSAGC